MSITRPDFMRFADIMIAENEIDTLKTELDNEKANRDRVLWKNNDMENSILKLQEQLRKDDFEWEYDKDLQNSLNLNHELTSEIQSLKDQLPELKEKLKNSKVCGKECRMKHDNLNINLDILTEMELMKTTKRLERMRVDLRSALISKEWNLDNESKAFQKIMDQKIHLQNQLYHTNTLGKKY